MAVITGTDINEALIGTTVNDTINGFGGNDTISGLGGNDMIDGGVGFDTALFSNVRSKYVVQRQAVAGMVFTVSDTSGVEGTDTLTSVEKLKFADTEIRLDIASSPGQAYRLYQAAFNRPPDLNGLGFWINTMDKGMSLQSVATAFITSSEFSTLYGNNPTNTSFLSKLYDNVLHRSFDQAGFDYWLNTLNSSANTQASVLVQFSESAENQNNILGLIGNGIEYIPSLL